MIKKIKRKIKQYAIKGLATLILISNIVFSYSTAVHASIIDTYRDYCEGFFRSYVGMMFNTARPLYDEFLLWLDLHKSDYSDNPNETSQEFIENNYTYTENNYTLNAPLINAMRDYSQDFIDENGFVYVYSWGMTDFITRFSTSDKYHKALSLVQQLEDEDHIVVANINYFDSSVGLIQLECNGLVGNPDQYGKIYGSPRLNWSESDCFNTKKIYVYQNDNFVLDSNGNMSSYGGTLYMRTDDIISAWGGSICLINSTPQQYICYKNQQSLQLGSEGQQSYYVTDAFNTSHVDNSVTIQKTNIDNSITSTNVNNYINNYYNDNGKYPTPNEISIYINNNTIINNPTPQPTPTPDPSDPGTGGGNNNPVNIENNPVINIVNEIRISLLDLFGDDEDDPTEDPDNPTDPDNPENPTDPEDPDNPGGGSGSDDNDKGNNKKEGIIARILKVIKKLAETVITLLTGIADIALTLVNTVIGLVTGAVTDLLDSINGIIDTFQGSLTNTAGQLIAYFIPFLPPEMTALIELFIVCCIVVGIIKLIRG